MGPSVTISLFVQCLVDSVYPRVAEAMVRVFERLGVGLDCPSDQTCCGQPAYNSGYHGAARKAARHFIKTFEHADVIVCPSGSCTDMVRHHYPGLFEDDPRWQARARRLGQRTFEFSEYLVDVLGVTDVGARYHGSVTYHDSCHLLRCLNVAEQPRRLIANVAGIRFVEMADSDRCCGFGGTFSVKYPHISMGLLEDKAAAIVASGADAVVGCDMSCLMNIQGLLSRRRIPVRTLHIAELLAGR
jgi:L-lactate dehydrogenase complex protein LldE